MLTPEHLAHFWGPAGMSAPLEGVTVDPRPGGVFETVMVADDGTSRYTMRAVYDEILEPERITWTEVESGLRSVSTFPDLGDGRTEVPIEQQPAGGLPHLGGACRLPDVPRQARGLPEHCGDIRMSASDTDVGGQVSAELTERAELPTSTWDAPSLCAGWRVREVVAHLTLPMHASTPAIVLGFLRAGFGGTCSRTDAHTSMPSARRSSFWPRCARRACRPGAHPVAGPPAPSFTPSSTASTSPNR